MRIRHRKKAPEAESGSTTVIVDAPAGPPSQPPLDRATLRLTVWQQGLADVANGVVDVHRFISIAPLQYLRVLRSQASSWLHDADRSRREDEKLSHVFIRNARTRVTQTKDLLQATVDWLTKATAQRHLHEKILLGEGEPETRGWKASDRMTESPRTTKLLAWGLPGVALLVETPWGYFALQELGEAAIPTVAMAFIFGFVGVLLAHVAGSQMKEGKVSGHLRPKLIAAAALGGCLVLIGLFLASVRTAALAAPTVTAGGQSVPSGLSMFHLSQRTVFLGWLSVNVGIWLAVGILANRFHNPHVGAYQRAKAEEEAATQSKNAAESAVTDAEEGLDNALAFNDIGAEEWRDYMESLKAFGLEARGYLSPRARPRRRRSRIHHGRRRGPSGTDRSDERPAGRAAPVRLRRGRVRREHLPPAVAHGASTP